MIYSWFYIKITYIGKCWHIKDIFDILQITVHFSEKRYYIDLILKRITKKLAKKFWDSGNTWEGRGGVDLVDGRAAKIEKNHVF